MKRLILLRHAKAEAKNAGGDFDRVLAPRGRSDMEAVAAYLAANALRPDLALVSPAARTQESWRLCEMADVPMSLVDAIYDASPSTLLAVVQKADPAAACAIVVGHNPGLEDLAAGLVAERAREVATLPTGALVVIDFADGDWSAIAPKSGRLDRFVTPADLAAATG